MDRADQEAGVGEVGAERLRFGGVGFFELTVILRTETGSQVIEELLGRPMQGPLAGDQELADMGEIHEGAVTELAATEALHDGKQAFTG
jgi:hypothetical protein